MLRQVLNWCVDEQLMIAKPRFPTLSVANVESELPADAAFLWVLRNVPVNHARALEFMMLTGLSPHELERVQVQDGPDNHSGLLAIGLRPDFPVKQASRRRLVPLNGRAIILWFETATGLGATVHPFPGVDAMQKAIVRARGGNDFAKRGLPPLTGADRITPKLMRKWFASKVSNDQPEHVLQRLMGHAPGSPITRRHYIQSTEEQGRDAVRSVTL